MQGGSDASSVLESLIIELIGDDSKLQAVFDSAVASARAAAGRISEAFTEGLGGVDQAAVQAARAWTDQRGVIDATTRVLEGMVAQLETAFNQTVRSGEKSKEAFEDYRREVLAVLDASEANARVAGVTTDAYERLRRTVRETEYAQKQQTEASRDQAEENRDLDDVIKNLSARVATQRNLWAGRITSDEEFERSTR